MLPLLMIDRTLQRQRGHLLPWVPVCLGIGIGGFFSLSNDPGPGLILLLTLVSLLAVYLLRFNDARRIVALALLLIALGGAVAHLRSHWVAAPVLEFRYYGPVEGRLIGLDRSSSGYLRMTLDQPRLVRVDPQNRPRRLRLSLVRGQTPPPIGAMVATTGHLMPPQGPAEPAGYDFRRHAWFQGLGANGYTRNPVMVLRPPDRGLVLQRLRARLSQIIRARLGPQTGGVAAALITGDRSAVRPEDLEALRGSNLAHLLAISGLHMGLLSAVVFAGLRYGLCLVPPLALRWNVKKIAALGALVVATGYLGLSGGNVATERAYIMVTVMLLAVLLDRRALSLRGVAVAATLVLLRRPETLTSPGFQMSFSATVALIWVFRWVQGRGQPPGPVWLRPVVTVMISSLVAGLATAPFGAAHFNTLAHFGLLANLLAVPVMGLVVVPAALLGLILLPFGLEGAGFWALEMGLRWILTVADWVAHLPQAQSRILSPQPAVLPLLTIGGLIAILLRGGLRWSGLPVMGLALLLWATTPRPLVLIAANGGLVGVMTPEGRALSRHSDQAFVAGIWLAGDGDSASQQRAADRWDQGGATGNIKQIAVLQRRLVHVTGRRQQSAIEDCAAGDLWVVNVPVQRHGPCEVLQPSTLRESGSILIWSDGRMITAAQMAGNRPWSRRNAR